LILVIDDAHCHGACAVEDELERLGVVVREFVGIAFGFVLRAEQPVVEANAAFHGNDGLQGEIRGESEQGAACSIGFDRVELFIT
jgi:hypothetical protein